MKHSFYKTSGKRMTALILSALLTVSLLAGCGGNGGSSASAGKDARPSVSARTSTRDNSFFMVDPPFGLL